jgi:uncharacterized protein (TIGR03643 family)
MSLSSKKKKRWALFIEAEKDRIIHMAWEDRTSFEDIEYQFGLSPNDVERFMQTHLETRHCKRWRRRIAKHGHLKHKEKLDVEIGRFKCTRQRSDGSTKGWK